MDNNFLIWLQQRKDEIILAAKYWPSIIKKSVISSSWSWALALGLMFVAEIISLGITYFRERKIDINDFFFPNFGRSILIVLIMLFLYQLIVESSESIEKFRIHADKFTWDDVTIAISPANQNKAGVAYLVVINKKPFDIKKAKAKIILIRKGRFLYDTYKWPLDLAWKDIDGEIWGGRTIPKNKEEAIPLPIASWILENKGAFLLAAKSEEIQKGHVNFIELEEHIIYMLQIQWFGEVDNRAMDDYRNTYSLKVEGENILLDEVK